MTDRKYPSSPLAPGSRTRRKLPEPTAAEREPGALLMIAEAAKLAGMGPATLRMMIDQDRVRVVRNSDGVMCVPRSVTLDLCDGRWRGGKGLAPFELDKKKEESVRGETTRGAVAAAAFDRFAKGMSLVDVVRELRQEPDVIEVLWKKWIGLQEMQRRTSAPDCLHHGARCSGAIEDRIGLCGYHAARSRILTEEQELSLKGQTIPTAVHCVACSSIADRGVCSKCVRATTIRIEGEGAGRRVVARAGNHTLAIVLLSQVLPDRTDKVESPKGAVQPQPTEDRLDQILNGLRAKADRT